ncbi:hypothetical protein LOY64_04350 [Pseudomonas corrugata]|uniref:hypothetical protein n=1 Tax=Pseudomonas corrugata TaxID=47879 RepID=UPI00222F7727|nr:hypothetical protein [Pseudomonas corrugata]UZD96244.1 hypothetical protein LOY64_04350 [Pseudomonas corrugata]
MSKIPEGTQFIEAGCGEKGFRKFEKGCWWFFDDFWRHVDWKMGALTLVTEHPDYAVPAAPWSGRGLPPVGSVCEFYADEDTWKKCKIVGENEGYLIVWVTHANIWTTRSAALLRPIRTPEQIEAEERENAVQVAMSDTQTLGISDNSKRILIERLYDAGYRKQPSP